MIRTLVVAPSTIVRTALAEIVRGDVRLALAGESDVASLGRRVRALDPDVVLEDRDASSDAGAGFGATEIPTVALVDDPHLAWSRDLARGDARGPRAILGRDAAPGEIAAAVVAVAAGLVALAPGAVVRATEARETSATYPAAERLTARETDVLRELARGVANKQIARRLRISEHTVKFHVAAIFAKLGVASRTEAVARGIRLGLVMV